MRGILEHDYGVPHKSIEWLSELDEDVDFHAAARSQHHAGARRTNRSRTCWSEGEIDALLSPDLIRPLTAGDKRVGRLFPNYKQEEIAFYRKTGIFPDHARRRHQAGDRRAASVGGDQSATRRFEQSKALAMERMENPRIVPLAWYREGWEEQERISRQGPLGIRTGWERNAQELRAARHLFRTSRA